MTYILITAIILLLSYVVWLHIKIKRMRNWHSIEKILNDQEISRLENSIEKLHSKLSLSMLDKYEKEKH